jgi:ribosome-associated translation inhibitor RaiA
MNIEKKLNKLHRYFEEDGNTAAAAAIREAAEHSGCTIARTADTDSGGTGNGPPPGP